jgi:CRP/FNR family transcriptional regulator, cyclic AMP receptor protein
MQVFFRVRDWELICKVLDPTPSIAQISQETLAQKVGTPHSCLSHFLNRFRELGLIEYNGGIHVHGSLVSLVLHD